MGVDSMIIAVTVESSCCYLKFCSRFFSNRQFLFFLLYLAAPVGRLLAFPLSCCIISFEAAVLSSVLWW
ncbi:hypothetical protein EXN66_Car017914 [Channa argus]|uniref:Uncharacterized protein n=1 Tax=Channa argus TaxID=215402 RepID=A0A6G1QJF5_CHAAH|nr:hypothetical protein EXN66_Car017914 [Channa argus]